MAAVAANMRVGRVEDLQLQHHVHLRHDAHQQQVLALPIVVLIVFPTRLPNAVLAAKPSASSTASARFFPAFPYLHKQHQHNWFIHPYISEFICTPPTMLPPMTHAFLRA
jgi:hypothetical protein